MGRFPVSSVAAVLLAVFLVSTPSLFAEEPSSPSPKNLKLLRKMYLSVHAGGDFNDYGLKQPASWLASHEEWPGRVADGAAAERELMKKYQQLVSQAKEDEGIFFVPTAMKSDNDLIALARKHFGDRCVVCNYKSELLGKDFDQQLGEDHRKSVAQRGVIPGDTLPGRDFAGWIGSKMWAVDLQRQLEQRGYGFDPKTVEFVAFGGDWMYCCGTFPIHMARAWNLAKGITRPFDLILKDESPLFMKLEVVDQNLAMPENIDLFIFKTPNEAPTFGRYIAEYYARVHGPMDRLHVVEVDFPPSSVIKINIFGWGVSRSLGGNGQYDVNSLQGGRVMMHVGCGGYVTPAATLVMVMAKDKDELSLADFRAALLAGKVSELQEEAPK